MVHKGSGCILTNNRPMHTEIKEEGECWTVTNQPGGTPERFASEQDAMRHAFAHPGPGMRVITPSLSSHFEEPWRPAMIPAMDESDEAGTPLAFNC